MQNTNNLPRETVCSRDLVAGDTIEEANGKLYTVNKADVSYFSRNRPTPQKRVLFRKWYKGEIIGYVTQL